MSPNFPLRAPVGLFTGGLFGLFSLLPILAVWRAEQPPVQKFYLGQYAASYLSSTPIGAVTAFIRHGAAHSFTYYTLVQNGHLVSGGEPDKGSALAVRAVYLASPQGFHAWLRSHVYGGLDFPELLKTPVCLWCFSALGLLGAGALLDFYRRKRVREGTHLRGGELLTVDQFNRATKGDGFALYVNR